MVLHIIHAVILLIVRIFPRPFGARKNTTQLAKYPRVLYAKPSIKIYLSTYKFSQKGSHTPTTHYHHASLKALSQMRRC